MLRSYLLVTLRNIRANKLFSIINIAGLAIGLSACFLIWQYVRFESSYDTFHANKDRLFRVPFEVHKNSEVVGRNASGFAGSGYAMKAEFPEVTEFCRFTKTSLFTSDLGKYYANALEFSREGVDGKTIAFIDESVWFTDASALTMFTFPLVEGTKDALEEPNSIVLTKSIARKYFGDEQSLGKELRLNGDMLLKVTGVIEDVPENSHLQFDILISLSTMRPRLGDFVDTSWGWAAFYTYVLLGEKADPQAVRAKLPELKDKYYGPEADSPYKTSLLLQPITDIHLRSQSDGEQSPVGSQRIVYFLSILAVFILVVAWINYINLSTSKALQRSKEVGLRKTVGATRLQLIIQFLFDTTLINCFALLIAVGLVALSWQPFESLVGKQIQGVLYAGGIAPWAIAAAVFIVGVMICGVYPALSLSEFSPATVLRGTLIKSSGTWMRKMMVSFQYVLAVLLIAGTVTIYLQLSYMRSLDTGFTKEQVIVAEAPAVYDSTAGGRIAFFRNELMKMPRVRNVTAASDVPGRGIVEGSPVGLLNADQDSFFGTSIASIDTSFFSTFEIELLKGRLFEDQERMAFRLRDKNERIPVLVNEEFVRRLGMSNLDDAIEQQVTFWWGPHQRFAKIIGVVANHNQVTLKEGIQPVMYEQPEWLASKYFAVAGHDLSIKNVEAAYARAFPGHPFTYFFLDEHFDSQYRDDQRFGKIFNTFTALAILVTCLGLLGLSIFSVTQRTKEVSIRKVLGAPASAILYIFSFDFLRALLISYTIALPVIYLAGENWLQNFSARIPLRWEIFVSPLLLLVVITMTTVVCVSIKAMFEAPVRALRQD